MLSSISYILLLIPISTAKRGFTVQCGKSTTLACLGPKDHTENKTINALWKKASGERVIWNYYGVSDRGETFKNRTKLNANLSLSIDECYQSDQGIYILCFNGEPRCHVRLFVQDSEKCTRPKTATGQSTRIPVFGTLAKQATTDEKHVQTETSQPNTYIRWVVYASLCLFVLVALLWVVYLRLQKEETSKNDKSGSKLLSKDKQSIHAGV